MIRRFGPPPDPARRYRLRAGCYAILRRGGDLLVTVQEAPEPEIQLPGGGIDPGESPLEALHREVLEETGWRIAGARRQGAFRRYTWMPDHRRWAEKLCHVYLAWPVRPTGAPLEPGHLAVWMPIDEAARRLDNAGDRHFVARLAGLQPPRNS